LLAFKTFSFAQRKEEALTFAKTNVENELKLNANQPHFIQFLNNIYSPLLMQLRYRRVFIPSLICYGTHVLYDCGKTNSYHRKEVTYIEDFIVIPAKKSSKSTQLLQIL
jgi:hypothetical protein